MATYFSGRGLCVGENKAAKLTVTHFQEKQQDRGPL